MEVFQALRKELEADFDHYMECSENKKMQNELHHVLWPPKDEGE